MGYTPPAVSAAPRTCDPIVEAFARGAGVGARAREPSS